MFKKLLLVALALSALPAFGAISFYAGPTANTAFAGDSLLAGLTMTNLINFSGSSSGTTVLNVGGSGVDFAGLYGSTPTNIDIVGSNAQFVMNSAENPSVRITTPGNAYALLVKVTTQLVGGTICFGVVGQACPAGQQATVGVGSTVYFGVVSDLPLPALQLTTNSGTSFLVMQSFDLGTLSAPPPAETPEPSSMALMGGALIALPLLARRLRRR